VRVSCVLHLLVEKKSAELHLAANAGRPSAASHTCSSRYRTSAGWRCTVLWSSSTGGCGYALCCCCISPTGQPAPSSPSRAHCATAACRAFLWRPEEEGLAYNYTIASLKKRWNNLISGHLGRVE
jgi:hypothetical protein